MKLIVFAISLLILLSGCAALEPPVRWIDNNTFYSTKGPSIEIKVRESMHYKYSPQHENIVESSIPNLRAGLDDEWFHFIDPGKAKLSINIETLHNQQRVYMEKLEWSKYPGILWASEQRKNGTEFSTGIITESSETMAVLAKVYSVKLDDLTRYKIVYREKVDNSWKTKAENLLTNEDRDFLSSFSNRADESFSIAPYSGVERPGI